MTSRWLLPILLLLLSVVNGVSAHAQSRQISDGAANTRGDSGSKLPIFFFHGLGAGAVEAGNLLANLTTEGRIFNALTFCEFECSFKPLQEQIPLAITQLRSIISANATKYEDGYIFVGLSQGALIARTVIEEWDNHNVRTFVSLAGPQNGLFYGPQQTDFVALDILATNYGPQVIDAKLFNFSAYTPADYHGKIQRAMVETLLTPELQNQLSVIDLLTSPLLEEWVNANPFLAVANNINNCAANRQRCAKSQQRRRANFLKLRAVHFFGSPQDDFISPWQSSILGRYTAVSTTEQIETRFSEFQVLDVEATDEYKRDTYGLKTLDKRGGLFLHGVPNVGHSCWIHDYTTFDGKLDCKFQPVYDKYIYPLLRDPLCLNGKGNSGVKQH